MVGVEKHDGDEKGSNKSNSSESWGLLDDDTDKAMEVAWVRGKWIIYTCIRVIKRL